MSSRFDNYEVPPIDEVFSYEFKMDVINYKASLFSVEALMKMTTNGFFDYGAEHEEVRMSYDFDTSLEIGLIDLALIGGHVFKKHAEIRFYDELRRRQDQAESAKLICEPTEDEKKSSQINFVFDKEYS